MFFPSFTKNKQDFKSFRNERKPRHWAGLKPFQTGSLNLSIPKCIGQRASCMTIPDVETVLWFWSRIPSTDLSPLGSDNCKQTWEIRGSGPQDPGLPNLFKTLSKQKHLCCYKGIMGIVTKLLLVSFLLVLFFYYKHKRAGGQLQTGDPSFFLFKRISVLHYHLRMRHSVTK